MAWPDDPEVAVAEAILQVHRAGLSLAPWTSLGLLAAYPAVLVALSALLLRQRGA